MSSATKFGLGIVLSLGLAVATGCSHDHDNRAAVMTQSIESMQTARQGLVDGIKQIDDTLAAVNALPTATDTNAAMTALNAKIEEAEDNAAKAKERSADMRERGREYINKWEDEMGNVTDPAMRQAMSARQQAVRDKFASIRSSLHEASEAYQPYIANLKDIQTAMALDMTPAGVKAVAPTITKVDAEGATLKQKINAVIAQLDSVTGSMTPATPNPDAK